MGSAETKTIIMVMTHTQVNFSASPRPEIGARDRGLVVGVGGRVGKSDKSGVSHGKDHVVHAGVNCVRNMCGSAHSCGCVVNSSFARAA